MKNALLSKEKVLFQIKEGMCSRRCKYCYEMLKEKAEMPLDVIEKYFKILSAETREAELIGSEPTEYSQWNQLIALAEKYRIKLRVYTSGLHLKRLKDEAVSTLILHLVAEPSETFMEEINNILGLGKFIYLRVNFDDNNLSEKESVFSFLRSVKDEYKKQISIKYSFTAKTEFEGKYFDLQRVKEVKTSLFEFCAEIKKHFPQVSLFSERPLFKCCFSEKELEQHADAGIVFSCDMEYTVYKDGMIALCPPVEKLVRKRKVQDAQSFRRAIREIRKDMHKLFEKPSFPDCYRCKSLKDHSCQGGCFSYKL